MISGGGGESVKSMTSPGPVPVPDGNGNGGGNGNGNRNGGDGGSGGGGMSVVEGGEPLVKDIGVKKVTQLDASEVMLARAREETEEVKE